MLLRRIIPLILALTLAMTAPCACSAEEAEVWAPKEAPAVRQSLPEEEKLAAQQAILDKGTLLFSGKTNISYNPIDLSWLKEAAPEDALALLWACDDLTHGGWGVLGLNVNGQQLDIAAVSDQPDKERLNLYTVAQLLEQAGVETPAELTHFMLGAWNGGRIAGLYLLKADVAAEMMQFQAMVAGTEAVLHTYTGELSNENAIPAAKAV